MEKKQRVTVEQLTKKYKNLLDGRTKIGVDEVYNLILDFSSDWDDRINGDTEEDAHYIGTISVQLYRELENIISLFLSHNEADRLLVRIDNLIFKEKEEGQRANLVIRYMRETLYNKVMNSYPYVKIKTL